MSPRPYIYRMECTVSSKLLDVIECVNDFNRAWQLDLLPATHPNTHACAQEHACAHTESTAMKWHQPPRRSRVNLMLKGFYGYWACSRACKRTHTYAHTVKYRYAFTHIPIIYIKSELLKYFLNNSPNFLNLKELHLVHGILILQRLLPHKAIVTVDLNK